MRFSGHLSGQLPLRTLNDRLDKNEVHEHDYTTNVGFDGGDCL